MALFLKSWVKLLMNNAQGVFREMLLCRDGSTGNCMYDGSVFVSAALAFFVLIMQTGCTEYSPNPEDSKSPVQIYWGSKKLVAIETEWRVLHDTYQKTPERIPGDIGKDKYVQLQNMIERLFRDRLSERELRQLLTSFEGLPVHLEDQTFAADMVAFMVKVFTELGDRESIVKLLSKRCPNFIDRPTTVEYHLAFRGGHLKDPMLVLGEAYFICQESETRHRIAAAVRRGFVDLGIHGKDEADYVKNAMQWYRNENGNWSVNSYYVMNETGSLCFTVEDYEGSPELYDNPRRIKREPLFKKKEYAPKTLVVGGAAFLVTLALSVVLYKRIRARRASVVDSSPN